MFTLAVIYPVQLSKQMYIVREEKKFEYGWSYRIMSFRLTVLAKTKKMFRITVSIPDNGIHIIKELIT